jgi:hypothetical protein
MYSIHGPSNLPNHNLALHPSTLLISPIYLNLQGPHQLLPNVLPLPLPHYSLLLHLLDQLGSARTYALHRRACKSLPRCRTFARRSRAGHGGHRCGDACDELWQGVLAVDTCARGGGGAVLVCKEEDVGGWVGWYGELCR